MDKDLEWLAKNVDEWDAVIFTDGFMFLSVMPDGYKARDYCDKDAPNNGVFYGLDEKFPVYSRDQWQAARRELGLDKPEDEMTDVKWSEWIEWIGGECPLTNGAKYQVRFRLGNECGIQENPELLDWIHHNSHGDIIAYRYQLPKTLDDCEPHEWDAASRAARYGEPTPEEDAAWREKEAKLIGQPPSKYHVNIKGVWLDVYDILHAYKRDNPADQHAIKKMLMPGQRGAKDAIQDRREAIQSLERAIELEEDK